MAEKTCVRIENQEQLFSCGQCTKSFKDFSEFHQHMKDHSNEEKLKLEPKQIEEESKTNEKRFQCAVCGKESSTSSLLKANSQQRKLQVYL